MTLILGETTYLTRAAADAYFRRPRGCRLGGGAGRGARGGLAAGHRLSRRRLSFLGALARPDQALAWPRQGSVTPRAAR